MRVWRLVPDFDHFDSLCMLPETDINFTRSFDGSKKLDNWHPIMLGRRKKNRYHRELPDFIIPYKHHCVETYAEIYDKEPNELECEVDEKTIRRIRAWVTAFMKTGAATIQRLRLEHPTLMTDYDAGSTLGTLKYFVKAVANSNEWKFTSSPLLTG